jgi:hypothetical protein
MQQKDYKSEKVKAGQASCLEADGRHQILEVDPGENLERTEQSVAPPAPGK